MATYTCSSCNEKLDNPHLMFREEGQLWAFCLECSDDYRIEVVKGGE